jgi:DNA-binding transcriptional LysR family regulator
MTVSDLSVFLRVASWLSRPTQRLSWNGVSRRIHLSDDKTRRAISRLEQQLQVSLVSAAEGGWLALTRHGCKLHSLTNELFDLARDTEEEPTELITVEIDDSVAIAIAPMLRDFDRSVSGLTAIRFVSLVASDLRSNLISRTTFAVSIDPVPPDVTPTKISSSFAWQLLVPNNLPLVDGDGTGSLMSGLDEASQIIRTASRVFVPPAERQPETLERLVKSLPIHRVVECDCQVLLSCVKAGLGVGILSELAVLALGPEYYQGVRLIASPALGKHDVCAYLPRNRKVDSLGDGATTLFSAIRGVIEELAKRSSERCQEKPDL